MVSDKVLSWFGLMTVAQHNLEIAINKREIINSKKELLRSRTREACLMSEIERFNKLCGNKQLQIETLNHQLDSAKIIMQMSTIKQLAK